MELFTLIVINIVTAVALYILFSVRFSLAVDKIVEKTRKNVVLKDLRENIEATVEYINTSLDLMDQKNRSFYQLVRRSEELIEKLEHQNGRMAPARPGIPAPDPDGHPDEDISLATGELTEQEISALQAPLADQAGEPSQRPPSRNPPRPAVEEQEADPDREDSASSLDRALSSLGDDRLEISGDGGGTTEEMYGRGEQSANFAARFDERRKEADQLSEEEAAEGTPNARRFQPTRRPDRLGAGLYPEHTGFTMDEVGRPEASAPDRPWLSLMEGAGRTVRRMLGMGEMDQPDNQTPARPETSSGNDRGWRSPPRETELENPFELLLREKQERLAEDSPAATEMRPDYFKAVGDDVPGGEEDAARGMTDFQRDLADSAPGRLAPGSPETTGEESEEMEELRERIRSSTPAGRREIILQMVERGYSRQNISALTGIARAEVDLVATLPAAPVRRRRLRNRSE